jgi:hypothetical protein
MRLNPQTYGRAWRKTQESGSPGPGVLARDGLE